MQSCSALCCMTQTLLRESCNHAVMQRPLLHDSKAAQGGHAVMQSCAPLLHDHVMRSCNALCMTLRLPRESDCHAVMQRLCCMTG
eukprot:2225239-Amphidinium_carterae.1